MKVPNEIGKPYSPCTSWLPIVAAMLGLICAIAVLYFGAYILMGSRAVAPGIEAQLYRDQWKADFFEPAARIESAIRGRPVSTGTVEPME